MQLQLMQIIKKEKKEKVNANYMAKLYRAKKAKTKFKINVVLTFSDMGNLNQRQMLKCFRYQKKNKAKQIKASLLNLQGKSTSN